MKKYVSILIAITLLVFEGVNCFAQDATARQKALNGTWTLVVVMDDEDYYDGDTIKSKGITVQFIFTGDKFTVKMPGKDDTVQNFTTLPGYIVFSNERWPYFVEGKILIIPVGSSTYIFRKK